MSVPTRSRSGRFDARRQVIALPFEIDCALIPNQDDTVWT
jgi:hypothetical protein